MLKREKPDFLSLIRRVSGRTKWMVEQKLSERSVRRATRHLSGKKVIALKPNEVVLVCLMKNASYYLPELLRHHRNIGVHHFLFIDNGSNDSSTKLLAQQPDVTVVENLLSVGKYECLIRSEVARSFASGGWFLFVDADELVEFPQGEKNEISKYTQYCNSNAYTAVVSQMLELFSSRSLSETSNLSYSQTIEEFNLYSLTNVESLEYFSERIPFKYFLHQNRCSNANIKFKFGGVRRELFNEDCAITKHSLVKNIQQVRLYSHPHCSSNVNCADFTILVRHYKFAGDFLERERKHVAANTWQHGEDVKRLSKMQSEDYVFFTRNSRALQNTDQLLTEGFLFISEELRNYLERSELHTHQA